MTQAVPRLEVRWSALFHDVGKVKTRSFGPKGEVHFFGHAEVGARMFDRLERRERLFSGDEALGESIRFLVLHHLRASQYDGSWTDSAVRRFAREMGPHLDNLLCLSRADITTKRAEKKRRGIYMIEELATRIGGLAAEDAEVEPLPNGVGNAMMEAFRNPAVQAHRRHEASPRSRRGSRRDPRVPGVRVLRAVLCLRIRVPRFEL